MATYLECENVMDDLAKSLGKQLAVNEDITLVNNVKSPFNNKIILQNELVQSNPNVQKPHGSWEEAPYRRRHLYPERSSHGRRNTLSSRERSRSPSLENYASCSWSPVRSGVHPEDRAEESQRRSLSPEWQFERQKQRRGRERERGRPRRERHGRGGHVRGGLDRESLGIQKRKHVGRERDGHAARGRKHGGREFRGRVNL